MANLRHRISSDDGITVRRLVPSLFQQYRSKALINACKEHRYLPVFAKRTALRKSIYDKVAERWSELGLPGQAPTVRAFEMDSRVIYHEAGGFEPGAQRGEK